jgi:hypothetical protein
MKKRFLLITLLLVSWNTWAQDTKIRFFAHTGGNISWDNTATKEGPSKSRGAFNAGGFDLFLTSQVSDRVSVLSENFIGYKSNGGNSLDFSIQRLFIKYAVNDYLNVKIGKMLSPLGYWNHTYNYGYVLQPTIDRPRPVLDKDQGGLINSQDVGIQLEGDNITALKLGYKLLMSNGVSGSDNSSNYMGKAFTLNLNIEPVEDLKFFVSGSTDRIKKGATFVQAAGYSQTQASTRPISKSVSLTTNNVSAIVIKSAIDVEQKTLNLATAYFSAERPLEFAAEASRIWNHNPHASDSIATNSFVDQAYAYVGYKVKNFTPYVVSSITLGKKNEILYSPTLATYRNAKVGLRYNFSPLAVAKLEYSINNQRTSTKTIYNQLQIQFAVGF